MTTAWLIVLAVFAAGCMGGLVNAVLAGELQLPKLDGQAGVYRPGWIGNVLVGGVTGLVFWGLYGPMSSAVLLGGTDPAAAVAMLRVSELFGALLSGIGGSRLLTSEVDKRLLGKKTEALDRTKDVLIATVKDLKEE